MRQEGVQAPLLLCVWLRDTFHPATKPKIASLPNTWQLLIYDHESQLNLNILEFGYEHKILVFCLPSHSTHTAVSYNLGCMYFLNLPTQL